MIRFRRAVLVAALLVAPGVVIPVTLIVHEAMRTDPTPADVIIVLGNKVELTGQPSPRLQARLDRALALYRAKASPKIVVSGGTGKEGFDEAKVMGAYLVARGVPRADVIEDPAGFDTRLTAKNAARYMRAHRLGSALVVSQWFHLYRCRVALRHHGIHDVRTAWPVYFEWRDVFSVVREIAALYDYLGSPRLNGSP